ncbi:MAG: hypothetical protein J5517_00865 [Eubacterium sp.]|nr:hypothetical protein [Eubacterium sp.]
MKLTFLIALGIYLAVFIGISIFDSKNIKGFNDYSVAGKKQSTFAVIMTLLATIIGASTTIGITDTVNSIGFPGIWWLLFGAIGLILQSFVLSERVRSLDADTLPHLAGKIVGKPAEVILALIIVISWVGVIAGQLVAMNSLITFAVGKSSKVIFMIVSLIVIAYTIAGGQLSVVKTDKVQLFIIFAGILICCIYLYFVKGGDTASVVDNVELLNSNYRVSNLFTQFFVIGGVFFLGPDIMSRNFLSKNEKTAKRSALVAGIILMVYAVLITFVGMWVKYNVTPEQLGDSSALMYVVGILPRAVSIILIFGLLSAILSSTDTCIINASSIFVKDILRKDSVAAVRVTVAIIGAISFALALLGRGDIMSLLTGAYTIYTPGVIFPLLVAILAYRRNGVRPGIWLTAVAVGGAVGILGTYMPNVFNYLGVPLGVLPYITIIGMGFSLLIAIFSVKK